MALLSAVRVGTLLILLILPCFLASYSLNWMLPQFLSAFCFVILYIFFFSLSLTVFFLYHIFLLSYFECFALLSVLLFLSFCHIVFFFIRTFLFSVFLLLSSVSLHNFSWSSFWLTCFSFLLSKVDVLYTSLPPPRPAGALSQSSVFSDSTVFYLLPVMLLVLPVLCSLMLSFFSLFPVFSLLPSPLLFSPLIFLIYELPRPLLWSYFYIRNSLPFISLPSPFLYLL